MATTTSIAREIDGQIGGITFTRTGDSTLPLLIPLVSSESADPDGDQLANLIEYALGLAPKSPDVSPVAVMNSGGYQALSAAKNPAATDIT